jgi:SAM-dependent methyltransferase
VRQLAIMNYAKLVNEIILSRKNNPVDLLQRGLGSEEYAYLLELQYTYTRTLNDLVPLINQINLKNQRSNMRVLEIGSLFGVVSVALKKTGFDVVATEYPDFHQSKKLQKIYSENNIAFDSVNLLDGKLPYSDESFDAVIICEVIEHLNFNPIPVLQEINRVLKKNGIIYLAMPNQVNLYNRVKFLFGKSIHPPIQYFFNQLDKNKNFIVSLHWREYTMNESIEMLERTNFNILRKYFFTEIAADKASAFSSPRHFLYRSLLYLFPSFRPSLVIIARKTYSIPHMPD